jgi:16S rRNA (guanine1207-N2)-methyltransferase
MDKRMNDHYYTREPQSESRPVECEYVYRGERLRFVTDAGVFSKGEVDNGTRLLLEALPEQMSGEILDLGCGWGVIGISIAKKWPECRVTMADVNLRALELSRENAKKNRVETECIESDGMAALASRTFDAVVTNPPIRAGKQVIYQMFADAAKSLKPGGALYLVIRKQQGAESCIKYLKTIYGEVEKLDRSGGFWVIKGISN